MLGVRARFEHHLAEATVEEVGGAGEAKEGVSVIHWGLWREERCVL